MKQRTDLAVLRFTGGPSVLIEFGFISNTGDRTFLIDRDNQHAHETANADFILLRSLTDLLVHLPTGKARGL